MPLPLNTPPSFNRRGDSLGGAAQHSIQHDTLSGQVSIAGAILWGVLLNRSSIVWKSSEAVSIAGAILWGVLPPPIDGGIRIKKVSIAGAILWGVLPPRRPIHWGGSQFQSQGRFFGGCCFKAKLFEHIEHMVSIAGAILWGVLLSG